MRRIPENLIDEVRNKSDIVETISQYLPLTKKGKNYWGLCPFHDDSNPSMSVSTDRQIFKCFVCGAGGNVFSFIKRFDNISFADAVIKQATNINVDMGAYANYTPMPVNQRKKRLESLMAEVLNFTSYQLHSKDGMMGQRFLNERGYPEAIIKKYEVGLSLTDNKIYNFLKAKGYEDDEMLSVDIIRLGDHGVQDVFYNRLMFPIHDQFDHVIAFSARTLDPNSTVKYINTSETELYTKGEHIYNLNRVKKENKTVDSLILCEGVTDVFAFDMAGITNVGALLGVALTDAQIKLIQKTTRHVVLAFDGDRAGTEATFNIGKKLVSHNINVSVWYNDSERDPDDLYREKGEKAIKEGLDHALGWIDFLLIYGMGQYGLDSFDNRKRVVQFVLPHLAQEDDLTQDYYLDKIAKKTGFSEGTLKSQLNGFDVPKEKEFVIPMSTNYQVTRNVSRAELEILKQMMLSKEAAVIYRDELGFLPHDLAFEFSLILIDVYRTKNVIEIADLLSLDLSDAMTRFVLEIEERLSVDTYQKEVVYENIGSIKARLEKANAKATHSEILNTPELDKQIDLLRDMIQKKRKK